MTDILVMNGINLDMFGKRDPEQYGTITLIEINEGVLALARELGLEAECFQSNHEGKFVEKIHAAHNAGTRGVVVNAGAWTHYSHGIADALSILRVPVVEVHMSNVHAREEFRRHSVLARAVRGSIAGFGLDSYLLGMRAVASML